MRLQSLEEILAGALALESERRAAYLEEVCEGNPALHTELESLLAVADRFPPPPEPPETTNLQASVPLPVCIGRYPVVGVVGAGGMGRVYRVRDPDLEREVALKRLPPDLRAEDTDLARFRREARALARLQHPNIATVHSLESDDEGPYLTMELVPGQTLHEALASGPLPLGRVLWIGIQIAAAMEAAHAEGIVHRDLKPLNIQVGEKDEVKVLDFGLAKAMDEPARDPAQESLGSDLAAETDEMDRSDDTTAGSDVGTLTGIVMGTPGYISPEHLLGRPVGPAADVWAFGCILFECLAGTSPFSATGSAARVPTRFRQGIAPLDLEPDLSLLPDKLPAAVGELMRACLRADPDDRPDAADARRTLEQVRKRLSAPSLTEWVFSRRGALAITCLLLAIVGAVMIGRGQGSSPVGIPASTVRQLTFHGNIMACDLSPDGETAAYLDKAGRMVYRDLQTGREQMAPLTTGAMNDTIVVVGARTTGLRWSPSGEELAVVGALNSADRTVSTFIVGRNSHLAATRIDGDFAGNAWSPDGGRLAGTRDAGSRSVLCIVERGSGLFRDIPLGGSVHPAQVLDWADDDWLYFRGAEQDSVYVVPASGGTPRTIPVTGWLRCMPDREEICYYADQQLRCASLEPDGSPADDYMVLADRLPRFALSFSLSRDGGRILYSNDMMIEAWIGERPDMEAGGGDFRWSRLVRESLSTFGTRFSPDGSRVALVGKPPREKFALLQTLSLIDGSREIVTRERSIGSLDWSPDGSEIVYRNSRGMARVRLDGSAPQQIPGPRDPMYIRWLPDGRIVYMERDGDLWRAYSQLDAATERIEKLPIDTERGTLFQFAVAPDGKTVAAAGNRGQRDEVKVWLIDLTDGSERLLYDGWAAPFEWSADGKWVYLITENEPESTNRQGSRVLRVAVDDGAVELVTDLPEPVFTWGCIDLSRDGRRIAFDQRRTGRDLWQMDIEPTHD